MSAPTEIETSTDKIADILKIEDEAPPADDLLADDTKKEEKEDVEEEEDIKLDDLDNDEEKEVEITDDEYEAPLSRKEVLAKYPNIFKEFPQLEKDHYRVQKYEESFATVNDAKEAVDKVKTLEKFEEILFAGQTAPVLKLIKERDDAAYGKIVDNYLATLYDIDKDAYNHVVGNTMKSVIENMWTQGEQLKNDDLKTAAGLLNQFIFGTNQYSPKTTFSKTTPETNKEIDQVRKEREEFAKQTFETVRDELQVRADNSIKSTIDKNIDPKGVMSAYIKKTAMNDCMREVYKEMLSDPKFRNIMDGLWKRAADDRYKPEYREKILNAYKSKAKTVLPQIIQKIRKEALSGLGRGKEKETQGPIQNREKSTSQKPSGNNRFSSGKKIPDGMSVHDFLMKD